MRYDGEYSALKRKRNSDTCYNMDGPCRNHAKWKKSVTKRQIPYVGFHLYEIHLCVCLSRFSHVRLFVTLWTVACQALLSMGILQMRILEWVSIPSSRGSPPPRDRTWVLHSRQIIYCWATGEAHEIHSIVQFIGTESMMMVASG